MNQKSVTYQPSSLRPHGYVCARYCLSVGIAAICIALLLSSCSYRNRISNPILQQSVDLLWSATDTAADILTTIEPQHLNDYDRHRYTLAEAHLMLKRAQHLPEQADLTALADYFAHRHDETSAGEALYIQGAYENWIGDNAHAMEHLKQAEHYTTTPIIRGMTYYKMGRISETEQLYDVAAHYYAMALPCLTKTGYPLYIASVYRELGRTVRDTTEGQVVSTSYMDSALVYARQVGDTLLYLDVLYSATVLLHPQSPEVADISRYLCLQAEQKRYAYDLVKYYIRLGERDSARHYLDILAQDSTNMLWSRTQYILWESQYMHLCGKDTEAYRQLLSLYNERIGKTDEEGQSRTFVIAQRYDNEEERAKNLQLQIDKQHLYITMAFIVIAVLVFIIIMTIYLARRRTQMLLQQERDAKQIEQLNRELTLRRSALRQVLEQRIALNKNLQEAILHKKENEAVPQWAQAFIETNIFSTDEQWQDFLHEFNGCHNDLLVHLQQSYPRLTRMDLQVIALILLGLDTPDICLLLGLTQRTIWSRRQRIKSRMDLNDGQSLETYLQSLLL